MTDVAVTQISSQGQDLPTYLIAALALPCDQTVDRECVSQVMQTRSRRLLPTELDSQDAECFRRFLVRKWVSGFDEEESAAIGSRITFTAQSLIILQREHRAGFHWHATRLTAFGFSNQQCPRHGIEIVRLQFQGFRNAESGARQ